VIVSEARLGSKTIVSPLEAAAIAARNEPSPGAGLRGPGCAASSSGYRIYGTQFTAVPRASTAGSPSLGENGTSSGHEPIEWSLVVKETHPRQSRPQE
jgi:hypothetical protein